MTAAAEEIAELYRQHLSPARASMSELFGGHIEDRSHGALIHTENGETFLNCAGYGVLILGATHPRVTEAVVEQIRRHPVSSRVLIEPAAARAAAALIEVCPPGLRHVHFVGSGAEATETAIKLARAHGKRRLVTTVDGYHGKTMGALSLTARELYQAPFRPLLPDVHAVSFGDVDALAALLADGTPSCFIVEPVQGEAGVVLPPPGYLTAVREVCDKYGCLMVVDEILTGLGRLGRWWGVDSDGVTPDVMLVGKGLSGGVIPVAAAVATAAAYKPFAKDPFLHTSTFAGAPVAMAAALAAVTTLRETDAVSTAARIGETLLAGLRQAAGKFPDEVREVRGEGLLIGVELTSAGLAGELLLELIDRRILVNHSLNNSAVLRLTPPAVLSDEQVDTLLQSFTDAFATLPGRG